MLVRAFVHVPILLPLHVSSLQLHHEALLRVRLTTAEAQLNAAKAAVLILHQTVAAAVRVPLVVLQAEPVVQAEVAAVVVAEVARVAAADNKEIGIIEGTQQMRVLYI